MTKGWQIALAVVLVGLVVLTAAWTWPSYEALGPELVREMLEHAEEVFRLAQ